MLTDFKTLREEEQRCRLRADIEQVRKERTQKEQQAERISYAAKMHVENNTFRLKQLDDLFYNVLNPTVDLETMRLKDVPIGGVVIDMFLDIAYVYVKTSEQVGVDGETLELRAIYASAGMPRPYTPSYFNRDALVVYTGIRIKNWEKLK